MEASDLVFGGRSFCFTGKLVDLKRSAAEREVRARGGLISDRVNERLDYLVIGDEPSPAWKHGRYGRKIEQARSLAHIGALRPVLVSEGAFMEALALCPPENCGAIDGKVVVCNYSFVLSEGENSFEPLNFERVLGELHERFRCHVTVRSSWASVQVDLYGSDPKSQRSRGALVITCRIARHQPLDEPVVEFLATVERAFERMAGVDGRLRWFERAEGSADYIRLLAEVPTTLRVPGI